jgi:hypothetical protein
MKNASILCLATWICGSVGFSQEQSRAPETTTLLLVQEIPLPNVGGRIDHFTFDRKRKPVIGAALGNNTVQVVDTFSGRDIHSITGGAAAPQGVVSIWLCPMVPSVNSELSVCPVGDEEPIELTYVQGAALWVYAPED